jgi:hypothetical protein
MSQPVWQSAAAWVRNVAQASAAYARVPLRGVLTSARTRAQRIISVVLLALGAAGEFGAVNSTVKALETRVTELGTRMTEGNAALGTRVTELGTRVTEGNAALEKRVTDTNNRLAALEASISTLSIGIQGVQSALLQLAAASAQPRTPPPHTAAARLPQDNAQQ